MALAAHLNGILAKVPAHRVLALDVLRGITITAMILVNNPGSWSAMYSPLQHAKWHGYTPTDLIFPFFLLIVGAAITLSVNAQRKHQISQQTMLKQGWVRSFKLFFLGIFLALFYYSFIDPNFNWWQQRVESIRILGVLQRIAIVYIITLYAYIYLSQRMRWCLIAALLACYPLIQWFVPYPLPDGTIVQGQWELGNSINAYLDHLLLTREHTYYGTAQPYSFDPEGLLSTLGALASALLGCNITAHLKGKSLAAQGKWLALFALVTLFIGHLLNALVPINKALWTSSYVFVSTGYYALLYALLIYLLDIKKHRVWSAPFIVFGSNAILFFMFAGIFARLLIMIPVNYGEKVVSLKSWTYSHLHMFISNEKLASLSFSLLFLAISYVLFYQLYKRDLIWKV